MSSHTTTLATNTNWTQTSKNEVAVEVTNYFHRHHFSVALICWKRDHLGTHRRTSLMKPTSAHAKHMTLHVEDWQLWFSRVTLKRRCGGPKPKENFTIRRPPQALVITRDNSFNFAKGEVTLTRVRHTRTIGRPTRSYCNQTIAHHCRTSYHVEPPHGHMKNY